MFVFKSDFVRGAIESELHDVDYTGREFVRTTIEALHRDSGLMTRGEIVVNRTDANPAGETLLGLDWARREIEDLELLAELAVDIALRVNGGSSSKDPFVPVYADSPSGYGDEDVWSGALGMYEYWPEVDASTFFAAIPLDGSDCRDEQDRALRAVPGNLVAAMGLARLDYAVQKWDFGETRQAIRAMADAWECAQISQTLNRLIMDHLFSQDHLSARSSYLGKLRHSTSRTGKARPLVKERWKEWKAGTTAFTTNLLFAQAMEDEFTIPYKTVQGWCTLWARGKE